MVPAAAMLSYAAARMMDTSFDSSDMEDISSTAAAPPLVDDITLDSVSTDVVVDALLPALDVADLTGQKRKALADGMPPKRQAMMDHASSPAGPAL